MSRYRYFCAALSLGLGISVVGPLATAQPLVIEGGTLIDGNGGEPLNDAVIVIEGNRITGVGTAREVSYPAGSLVIDASGKYVLPGLWDAMVSYQWFYGEIMLNHGITSIVDVIP
jgi:adenine deaminase